MAVQCGHSQPFSTNHSEEPLPWFYDLSNYCLNLGFPKRSPAHFLRTVWKLFPSGKETNTMAQEAPSVLPYVWVLMSFVYFVMYQPTNQHQVSQGTRRSTQLWTRRPMLTSHDYDLFHLEQVACFSLSFIFMTFKRRIFILTFTKFLRDLIKITYLKAQILKISNLTHSRCSIKDNKIKVYQAANILYIT